MDNSLIKEIDVMRLIMLVGPVVVQEHKGVTLNAKGYGFNFHVRKLNTRQAVEFCHSTHNASGICWKIENGTGMS